jgi:hypothetical protein
MIAWVVRIGSTAVTFSRSRKVRRITINRPFDSDYPSCVLIKLVIHLICETA